VDYENTSSHRFRLLQILGDVLIANFRLLDKTLYESNCYCRPWVQSCEIEGACKL